MAVTPEDLLVDAQLAALRSARELPAVRGARQGFTPGGEGRGQAAFAAYVSHRTAWPALAAAGRHALESVPMSPGVRRDFDPLIATLQRIERRSLESGGEVVGEASPQLLRTAVLVGAAGDAMRERVYLEGVPGDELDRQTRAAGRQVAAPLLTVARLTLSYLEQSPASQHSPTWAELHDELQRSTSTAALHEPNIVTSRLVPDTLDSSLASALGTWHRHLDQHLGQHHETGADVPGITDGDLFRRAHGIASVHAAAAATAAVAPRDDHGPADQANAVQVAHRAAAHAWLRASRTWSHQLLMPGRRRPESDAAHEALMPALTAYVAALRRDDADPAVRQDTLRDTAALTRFVRAELPLIAADHVRLVDRVVDGGAVLVRARPLREAIIRGRLDPLDLDGRPDTLEGRAVAVRRDADLGVAVRRGGWVPLPRYAEPAFQVRSHAVEAVAATSAASAVAAVAGGNAAAAAGFATADVEALAARAASAPGFPAGPRHRPYPVPATTSPAVEPGRPPTRGRAL